MYTQTQVTIRDYLEEVLGVASGPVENEGEQTQVSSCYDEVDVLRAAGGMSCNSSIIGSNLDALGGSLKLSSGKGA